MTNGLIALHNGRDSWDLSNRIDSPVPAGMVRLRVRASGICGSDLHYYPLRKEPETLPGGHEIAAEVVECGPGVSSLRAGDHVTPEMVGLVRSCMSCWYCLAGHYVKCTSPGQRFGGGFAEYLTVPAISCFKLPTNLSWEEGALVEPLAVAVHAYRRAEFHSYETAVVLGAGTIGLSQIAAIRAMGAAKIIATARYEAQGEMARRFGADIVIAAERDEPWMEAAAIPADRLTDHARPAQSVLWSVVADATGGRGADAVFECVGGVGGAPLNQAISISRKAGRVVSVGAPKALVPINVTVMLRRELSLVLSHCYSHQDGKHDYEIAIDLIARGLAKVRPMVTHMFPLKEINKGYAIAGDKKAGALKVQLLP